MVLMVVLRRQFTIKNNFVFRPFSESENLNDSNKNGRDSFQFDFETQRAKTVLLHMFGLSGD